MEARHIKVLFISRATLFSSVGGDTIQVMRTAEALEKFNVEADIKLCSDTDINYKEYQLIHFFNIIRPADILVHISRSGLPYVISTIYVNYSDYEKNTKQTGVNKILSPFGSNTREYIKVMARWLTNGERVISKKYLLFGHRFAVQYILKKAALLLPNSEHEYRRLLQDFQISKKYIVVPNAADAQYFNYKKTGLIQKEPLMVICVGRIEGRKNQLNLIRALNNTEFQLYIIGKASPNHASYMKTCRTEAAANVFFIDEVSQANLLQYYGRAKVHVLPSWFETTGLSSMEALFCGCNIVVTKYGDTMDYFPAEKIGYCNPASPESIREEVIKASIKDMDTTFIDGMMQKYNWTETAKKTREAYNRALN